MNIPAYISAISERLVGELAFTLKIADLIGNQKNSLQLKIQERLRSEIHERLRSETREKTYKKMMLAHRDALTNLNISL
ncbi:17407_t:CDS:2, partial [Cetraspora pellucida]